MARTTVMNPNKKKSLLRGEQLYKVLVDGRSCWGGSFAYDLPTQREDGTWKPGAWTPDKDPILCDSGYHLTTEPFTTWAKPNMTIYEAEGKGSYSALRGYRRGIVGDKIAFTRVRLLRPIQEPATLADAQTKITALTGAIAQNFLTPDGAPDAAWKVFHTEREAAWNLSKDAGFRVGGLPTGMGGAKDAYFVGRITLPSVLAYMGYKTGAYPNGLVHAIRAQGVSGTTNPLIDSYIAAYTKGYGVAGHKGDTLYVYEAY